MGGGGVVLLALTPLSLLFWTPNKGVGTRYWMKRRKKRNNFFGSLCIVHSTRDNFIRFFTSRAARGTKHVIEVTYWKKWLCAWWVVVAYGLYHIIILFSVRNHCMNVFFLFFFLQNLSTETLSHAISYDRPTTWRRTILHAHDLENQICKSLLRDFRSESSNKR